MIKKVSIAAAVIATVAGTVVYNMSDAVILPPKTLKLAWDYPYTKSNVLFNVYECDRFLVTNIYSVYDEVTLAFIRTDTNIFYTWNKMKLVNTTSNQFYIFSPTNEYGFFSVKTTNTLTKKESL